MKSAFSGNVNTKQQTGMTIYYCRCDWSSAEKFQP